MRKTIGSLATLVMPVLLVASTADAQVGQPVPRKINLQGVLRNAAGEAITGSFNVAFRLFGDAACATQIGPVHNVAALPVIGGAFSTEVDLGANPFIDTTGAWMSVQVDGASAIGCKPLTSMAYAFQAEHAEVADVAATATSTDTVDGAHAGNAAGNVALNNGTLNSTLNADLLDGLDSTSFVRTDGSSGSYIKNQSGSVQASASFRIDGSGSVGTEMLVGTKVTAKSFYDSDGALAYYLDPAGDAGGTSAKLAGKVGIGTTAPAAALHVNGDGYALFGPNSNWGAYLTVGGNGRQVYGTNASVTATNGNLHLDSANSSYNTYLNYYSEGPVIFGNYQAAVTASGSLGLGTTSPGVKLDVRGQILAKSTATPQIEIQSDDGDSTMHFHDPGNYDYVAGMQRSDGFKFKINRGGSLGANADIVLDTAGNTGFGKSAGAYKVDVQGAVNATQICISGDCRSGAWPGGDNLGNHSATQALSMNANPVVGFGRLEPYGIGGDSGQPDHSYAIFQEGGAWVHPYPDLRIAFHTGIKLGAHWTYGGVRFFNNSDMVTQLFSVGDGDQNVRVYNSLNVIGGNQYMGAGNIYFQNYGIGIVGTYTSDRYQQVFAMGDAYKLPADGTGTANMYGIAWTHSNVGGESKGGLEHQALFMMHGQTQTAIGNGIWTRGNQYMAGGNTYYQNFGLGMIGSYDSTRYQAVFAMGDAYKLPADGTSPGTLYGIAWTHSNVGGQSISGLGHQALFMENGVTQTAIGNGVWTRADMTAAGEAIWGYLGLRTTHLGGGGLNRSLRSGFYDGTGPDNPLPGSWAHIINSQHYNGYEGNSYNLQIGAYFWGDDMYWRVSWPGRYGPWQTVASKAYADSPRYMHMNFFGCPTGDTALNYRSWAAYCGGECSGCTTASHDWGGGAYTETCGYSNSGWCGGCWCGTSGATCTAFPMSYCGN